MSEVNKKSVENEKDEEVLDDRMAENLEAVGQIILGEIEKVGGILLADPGAQAEGDFNVEMGSLHQEVNKKLTATDPVEEKEEKNSEENE